VTQRQCQELFETYNRCFFNAKLPPYRIVIGNRYGAGDGYQACPGLACAHVTAEKMV
jgi:hypothetical protein